MTDDLLPEGYLVNVEMEICVPIAATMDQIEEWLHFNLTSSGGMSNSNPLVGHTPQIFHPSDFELDFTGRIGTRVECGHQDTNDGGYKYKVRYEKKDAE